MRFFLLLLFALALSACPDPDIEIDPAALVGCRSPSEPGCAGCCDSSGVCYSYQSSGSNGSVAPWYNQAGKCAEGVDCSAMCASCTVRDEEALRETAGECDCDEVEIGIDPCHSGGCPCTCSIYLEARSACPAP